MINLDLLGNYPADDAEVGPQGGATEGWGVMTGCEDRSSLWLTGWVRRRHRTKGAGAHVGLVVALVLACLLLALLGELGSRAARTFGVVEGRVFDRQGQPVAGVEVRLLDADSSGRDDAMGVGNTDAAGYYRIEYVTRVWDCCKGMREADPDLYAEVWRKSPGAGARWELLRRSEVYPDHDPTSNTTIYFALGK